MSQLAHNAPYAGPELPDDLATTLRTMKRFISDGSKDPRLIKWARDLCADLPDRRTVHPELQDVLQIRRVWEWVNANIRYVHDPQDLENGNVEGELLAMPEATLNHGAGDCDDMTILVGALLAALGIKVELWMAGNGAPSHIFLIACCMQGAEGAPMIVVDCTLAASVPFGSYTAGPGWEYWPSSFFGV